MKQSEKDAWVAALRSGDYLPIQETLRGLRPDAKLGHCCLGVGADISDRGTWSGPQDQYVIAENEVFDSYGSAVLLGPHIAYRTADGEPLFNLPLATRAHLVDMNDKGVTFSEIADYIEQNIPADEDEI